MRDLIKKSIAFLAAGLTVVALGAGNVYAGDSDFYGDASGNWFGAGQTVTASSHVGSTVDNELFMAGMDVNADNVEVDGSVFLAGNTVSFVGSEAGGSIFAAGQSVVIDAPAKNNIWMAGNTLTLRDGTAVKGLHAAGNVVTVSGEYEAVTVSGSTVTFNGKATGDVEIEGDNVTIGENAEIGGELKVKSKVEPTINSSADVASYTFEQVTEDEDGDTAVVDADGKVNFAKVGKAAAGLSFLKRVTRAIKHLFRYALLALIFAIVLKKNLSDSYEYATKKPGAFWGFGALTLLFFPLAAIILCITIIGTPVAGLLGTLYVLAICFANVFAFSSLVRELIFTHTSKRLNPILETVLAVLPAAIIKEIPVIGGLVGFACCIYTMGYIVLAIANTISANKEPKAVEVAGDASDVSGVNATASEDDDGMEE